MTIDKAKLRALAEAAEGAKFHTEGFEQTSGAGHHYGGLIMHENGCTIVASCVMQPWADFIAAANPATVLALLAEIERLEISLNGYQQGAKVEADAGDQARAEVRRLKSENDKLRAVLRRVEKCTDGAFMDDGNWQIGENVMNLVRRTLWPHPALGGAVSDGQKSETTDNEALRKDAERYRWLRSRDVDTISKGGVFAGMTPQNLVVNEETLDDAIDAAMSKEAAK